MYTQEDQLRAHRAWQKFFLIPAALVILLAVLWTVSCIMRWPVLGYIAAVVVAVVMVASWGFYGAYLHRYDKLMRDLAVSQRRELCGTVASVTGPVNLHNELTFMALRITDDEQKEQAARQVYVDTRKWPLPLQPGSRVKLTTSGNIVVDAEVI